MDLKTERENGVLLVEVEGRIDGSNSRDFEDAMNGAVDGSDKAVIVDMTGLSYISSAGLRAVLLLAKTLWKRDAKFMLCSLPGSIREVIEISGFHKIIPVHDSRESALTEAGNS